MTITAISIPAGAVQVSAAPVYNQSKGNWNQTTTYIINDTVFRGVSTYRALAINTNDDPMSVPPSGNWALAAEGLDPTALNAAAATATNASTQAAASATQAAASATLAAAQISGAASYAGLSQTAAQQAQGSVVQAQTAAGSATTSATNAGNSATAASTSAAAAAGSASAAAGSATSAATSAITASSWAMQTSGTVDGTNYSAKYWAQQAATSAASAAAGGTAPSGTFTVGNLFAANNGTGTSFVDSGIAASSLAPLASPAFTGTPTAPTPAAGDSSTKLATTAFVLANGGGAPSAVIPTTSGTTQVAGVADKGKAYLLSGSSTLQLPAAVQVAGWYAWVKKMDGNGVWAITPTIASGTAPTIEGLASINCYQEAYLVWWDSANSVFRTQGRPKGWINIGSTVISSAVAAVNFTTGFGDTELRDMMFDAENIVFASVDQLGMRVQKSSTYQTANYTGSTFYYGQSTGTGAPSAFVNLGGQGTSAAGATVTLWGFGQNTGTQRIEGASISANFAGISQTYQTTAAPITGVQFFGAGNGVNLSSGTINQKAFRP